MNKQEILVVFISILLLNCGGEHEDSNVKQLDWQDHWENRIEKEELLANTDLHYRIKECLRDSDIVVLTRLLANNLERYNRVQSIGDINGDGKTDSILIIPELYITKDSSYESGASVIFIDRQIPRIKDSVVCVNLDFIKIFEDIDEDGNRELIKYWTSCVSRFKNIKLLTLENEKWREVGRAIFDTFYDQPEIIERFRKEAKNQFSIREITGEDGELIDRWIRFDMK